MKNYGISERKTIQYENFLACKRVCIYVGSLKWVGVGVEF